MINAKKYRKMIKWEGLEISSRKIRYQGNISCKDEHNKGQKWYGPNRSRGEGDGTPLQYSCLENPMDGGAWWAAVHGVAKESDTTEQLHFHLSLSCIGEGNGNPLQCSCLESPRDGGAWWSAVSGVAQSRT